MGKAAIGKGMAAIGKGMGRAETPEHSKGKRGKC